MSAVARQAWLVSLLTLWPVAAWAHVQASETEGLWSGLWHPVSGLDHVMAMIAVGLWGAQLGAPALWMLPVTFPMAMAFGGMLGLMGIGFPGVEVGIALSAIVLGVLVLRESRPPLWVAAVVVGFCWLIGGLAGLQQPMEISLPVVTTLSFLVLGGLVAADRKLPFGLVVGLGALLGFGHGYLNGTAMSEAQLGVVGLIGIGCAVFVIVSLAGAFVLTIRADWARIAVRVAGSWIAAIGLLLLGWTFRGT